jgi:hypothetical protein
MEAHEPSDQNSHHHGEDVGCDHVVGDCEVEVLGVVAGFNEDGVAGGNNHPASDSAVEQHTNEVLVVVESHAVGNPRAMVVHLQNASIALRAVMTTVRLSLEAPMTYTYTSIFLFLDVKNHFA